ncbi:hypothetical protein EDD18DRAFT_1343217 [Armillaria luteobubalina]|uniref:F-box domain-containing protein n=1 Tax=Armillaria luteobubalina TaxID=153913 RepID=A0AA39QRW8_9AGAR|nr:hypothetical protein EDD18DRAFT_1343217 [Armillaria luteobubalina]
MNDISHLQAELSALDVLFNEVADRCSRVHKELIYHQAALTPVQTLPADLLVRIFSYVPVNTLDPLSSPWIFSCICAAWRSISLSVPGLWSTIWIQGYRRLPSSSMQVALERCVVRSQPHPLNICIHSVPVDYRSQNTIGVPIMDLRVVAVHAPRWCSLEVEMTLAQMEQFFSMVTNPVLGLKMLRVFATDGAIVDESPTFHTSVFSMASIVHADLQGVSISNIPFLLTDLIDLSCDIKDPSELLSIFHHATKLEDLTITPPDADDIVNPKNLAMEHCLNICRFTINVSWLCRNCLPRVPVSIDTTRLSGLEALELVAQDGPIFAYFPLFDLDDMHWIHGLVKRSTCILKRFTVHSPIPYFDILPILIMQGNSLTVLHLFIDVFSASSIFHCLGVETCIPGAFSLTGSVLLPNLVELMLSEITNGEVDVELMGSLDVLYVTVLLCRQCPKVTPLKSLNLCVINKTPEDLQVQINYMATFGLGFLLGLREATEGLEIKFIVGGIDLLHNSGWLRLLGCPNA